MDPQQNTQNTNATSAQPAAQEKQAIGLKVNTTLRTKEGLYLKGITFQSTNCKFLVLKSAYNDGITQNKECYLTANFTTQSNSRGISIHVFDSLNPQDWKIDNWSKAVKTGLNIMKLRNPTEDELTLIKAIQKNLPDTGLNVFFKKPLVVEAAISANNPKIGTNSENKQNKVDVGQGTKQKEPNAAVQGAVEGLSIKNPALESASIVFDRIIRESLFD